MRIFAMGLMALVLVVSCKDEAHQKDDNLLIGRNEYTTSNLDGHQIYVLKKDGKKRVMNGYYIVGDKFTKWEEFEVKNGLLNGVYIIYEPKSGALFNKQYYREGILHGTDSTFYASGNVKSIKTYDNGKVVGESFSFYENGQIESKSNYKDEEVVKSVSYDDLGHITSQLFIEDSRKIMQEIKDGKIKVEHISSTYDDFEAVKLYDDNGKVEHFFRTIDDTDSPMIILLDENENEIKRITNRNEMMQYMVKLKDYM